MRSVLSVAARALPALVGAGAASYGAWLWSLPSGWAGWLLGGLIVLADLVWTRMATAPAGARREPGDDE